MTGSSLFAATHDRTALLRVSRRIMATTFEVTLPVGAPDARPAAEAALDLADALEQQLTVYRADSEVAELNRVAAQHSVRVEAGLFTLLERCATLTQSTGGAFDVASGALISVWNHARRLNRIPTATELRQARAASGMRHVLLNATEQTVKFRVPGLSLNFGSVGKGYALDRMAELLRTQWGVRAGLVHAGGSSLVALGAPPHEARGWLVAVRHPANDERLLGQVWLSNQALGTSAATFQFFEFAGKRYGHLLDPRTGLPAEGVASASLLAPTGLEADATSTAAFVLGEAFARDFCTSRPDFAALLLESVADAPAVTVNMPTVRYQPASSRIQ